MHNEQKQDINNPMCGFRIKAELKERLEAIALERNIGMSDIIRAALDIYLPLIAEKKFVALATDKDEWVIADNDGKHIFIGSKQKALSICKTLNKSMLP